MQLDIFGLSEVGGGDWGKREPTQGCRMVLGYGGKGSMMWELESR